MRYFVYILKSYTNGRYYVGQTADLLQRIEKHNAGHVTSTNDSKPWNLVWREEHATRSSAIKRERQIKGWKSRRQIERLIGGA